MNFRNSVKLGENFRPGRFLWDRLYRFYHSFGINPSVDWFNGGESCGIQTDSQLFFFCCSYTTRCLSLPLSQLWQGLWLDSCSQAESSRHVANANTRINLCAWGNVQIVMTTDRISSFTSFNYQWKVDSQQSHISHYENVNHPGELTASPVHLPAERQVRLSLMWFWHFIYL